jgi:serine/threonine-protein kinase
VNNDDAGLTGLAGAILDGTPVDWEAADSGATPHDRPLVTHLRAIAAIAEAHRGDALETWGPLRLLEPIGRGAFGDVYRAWDSRLDREVALKLLPADPSASNHSAASIIEEGRLLARVRHPNVVTIHGAERIDDRVGLWMEYVGGRTLHQLVVEDGRRFTPREVASIGHALCSAVAAVHGAGLLHRDIKAQNVMLAGDGRVVLMDFGSGHDRGGPSAAVLAGTPLYLAPEVLAGTSSPSVQSDIYSIGVLLFFLLTGSYPATGADLAALRRAHEHGERRPLKALAPKVPRGLVRSVERAIHPRAERRHQSADELASDLSSVGRRWGRMALPYAAAAAAAIAAAAIAIISWQVVTDRQRASTGVPARPPAIAVLPFENLSKEADSEEFADGLTYEIHRYLAGIEGLELRSATSSFAFKSKPRDLADVAKQLDVDYVLEGTILKSGSKLRVSPRLTRVAGNTTVWAYTYDREVREVFATLDEMSLAIVNSLRLKLGRGQRRYETDPELYAQFLKAHGLRSRGHPVNSRKAAELFEAIVAKDPSFAPAWAGLASAAADATRWKGGADLPPTDPRMEPAALKAIQIDPLLAEAHAAMGSVYAGNRDWTNAERSFLQSLDLNPSLTTTYSDFVHSTLRPMGKTARALQQAETARRIDPLSLEARRTLAVVQLDAGHYEDAVANARWVLQRDPTFPYMEEILSRALIFAGKQDEALLFLQKNLLKTPQLWGHLAYLFAVTGRRAEAEALAAQHPDAPVRQAMIYAGLGDKERAFEALERAATRRRWFRVAVHTTNPELALLRGDPRLNDLRRQVGVPPLEDR